MKLELYPQEPPAQPPPPLLLRIASIPAIRGPGARPLADGPLPPDEPLEFLEPPKAIEVPGCAFMTCVSHPGITSDMKNAYTASTTIDTLLLPLFNTLDKELELDVPPTSPPFTYILHFQVHFK